MSQKDSHSVIFLCTIITLWEIFFTKKFHHVMGNHVVGIHVKWGTAVHICFLVCITHYYISISKKVFPHASYFLDTIFCYVFVKKEKIVQLRTTYVLPILVLYIYFSIDMCHTVTSLSSTTCAQKQLQDFFLQKAQKSWTAAYSCLKMEEISSSMKNERYFKG